MPAIRTEFVQRLDEWQGQAGVAQREFARLIGRHESELSMYRSSSEAARRPSEGFMRAVISVAPEPWKSALIRARQVDRDAADAAAMAVA